MEGMKTGMSNLLQTVLKSSTEPHICPYCEKEVPKIEVVLFGRKKVVQPVCKCESEAELKAIEEIEKAATKREIERKFASKTLGARLVNASFDNFGNREGSEKALAEAKNYVAEFEQRKEMSLYIHGTYGNGKSHLAGAIKNELDKQGKTIIFQDTTELIDKIKSTFDKDNPETQTEVINYLVKCDLLILDDIGAEKMTEWVQDRLFRIINKRYSNLKPILYTSNLKPSKLAERVGERIFDRIIETVLIVENKASSFRQEKAIKNNK